MARVVGERRNEFLSVGGVAGGVADAVERAKNGKEESEEKVDVVVVEAECGELGEPGIEIGLWMDEPPGTVGMTRGESLGRLDAERPVPGSCLIFGTVGVERNL